MEEMIVWLLWICQVKINPSAVVRKRQLVERCPEQVRGMGLRHRYTNA
jgi:hypothetical protein